MQCNGALLFQQSLVVPMKPHCSDEASLFQWSLLVWMESLSLFQWSLIVPMVDPRSSKTLCSWLPGAFLMQQYSRWAKQVEQCSVEATISIDWSSPNGPIKCQFQICRIQTIMTGDQCMYVSFSCILLPKYLQLHKIGPHCVMSDNLLRSSPCYRPNTITLMALALIRQSLLITLLLDKVSNDDHVATWENLF